MRAEHKRFEKNKPVEIPSEAGSLVWDDLCAVISKNETQESFTNLVKQLVCVIPLPLRLDLAFPLCFAYQTQKREWQDQFQNFDNRRILRIEEKLKEMGSVLAILNQVLLAIGVEHHKREIEMSVDTCSPPNLQRRRHLLARMPSPKRTCSPEPHHQRKLVR